MFKLPDLYSKGYASCGQTSEVFEAFVPYMQKWLEGNDMWLKEPYLKEQLNDCVWIIPEALREVNLFGLDTCLEASLNILNDKKYLRDDREVYDMMSGAAVSFCGIHALCAIFHLMSGDRKQAFEILRRKQLEALRARKELSKIFNSF